MTRRLLTLTTAVAFGGALVLALARTAEASASFDYDFGSCAQVTGTCALDTALGSTLTFTSNGVPVTADGFSLPSTPAALFIRSTVPTALGIASEANHEIDPTEFVSLDLSGLAAQGITSALLAIDGVAPGPTPAPEQFRVCNSTADNVLCSASTFDHVFGANGGNGLPNTWAGTVAWSVADPFIDVTGVVTSAVSSDVLIDSLAAVPESSTWAMLLIGFAGLGLAGYRRGLQSRS